MLGGCGPTSGPDGARPSKDAPRLLEALGGLHHPIETKSPLAQRYFDQGLALVFGFNHEAAIASFEEAARLDRDCAMCVWGIGLALGPNINLPIGPKASERAYRETQRALKRLPKSDPSDTSERGRRERAYIEALAKRYSKTVLEDRAPLDLAYADAMRALALADPSDLTAATLFAESLMDLSPWNYWTPKGEPQGFTQEMTETLERVLEVDPKHIGANHYYIHAVEEFYPERGEAAADRLGSLAPDAGHLVHMPSHIYWRLGRYEDATEINRRAAAADEQFFSWCRPGAFYQAAYYPHNLHFLWAAAATEGRSDLALMTARKLAAATRPALSEMPLVQEFVAIPLLTLARFGRWDALLAEKKPADEETYVSGIWHYTHGLAQVRTGALEAAQASLAAIEGIAQTDTAESLMLAGGSSSAQTLLGIAAAHLKGELALERGESAEAVRALQKATELHDELPYMEPPPWYAPPRQALGVALLADGRAEEAEKVYRQDLAQYPKNGWSLLGLSQSLRAQELESQARWARKGFENAWARADLQLKQSRF